jgi:hypothetical protein
MKDMSMPGQECSMAEEPLTYLLAHPGAKKLGGLKKNNVAPEIRRQMGGLSEDRGLFGMEFTRLVATRGLDTLQVALGAVGDTTESEIRELVYEGWIAEALKYFVELDGELYLAHCWTKPQQKLSTWPCWAQSDGEGYDLAGGRSGPGKGHVVANAVRAKETFEQVRGKQIVFLPGMRFDGDVVLKEALWQKLPEAFRQDGRRPKVVYALNDTETGKTVGHPVFSGKAVDICNFFKSCAEARVRYFVRADAALDEQPTTIVDLEEVSGSIIMNAKIIGGKNPPGGKLKQWQLPKDQFVFIYTKLDSRRTDANGALCPQLWTVFVVESEWKFERRLIACNQ